MPPKKKNAAPPAKRQKKAAAPADDDQLAIEQDDAAITLAADPPPPIPSEPSSPISRSYTYASRVPSECSKIDASNPSVKVPCVLGVDEAGRGPVLGPLVYGIAYCPISYQEELKQIGFADSKALTAERRDALLSALIHHDTNLGWAVRVMSPQDISAGMLRRRPINLNAQSSQATVSLIAGVLESGVDVTEIYVDTVGDPKGYSRLLSSHFPRHAHIKWTVTSKADAIYPIVGAASIAAKVTRDRCIEGWRYAEQHSAQHRGSHRDAQAETNQRKATHSQSLAVDDVWSNLGPVGSGYPGDPNTVAFLKRTLDPVFGWPGIVRFSWATAKTMLDEKVKPPTSASKSTASKSTSTTPTLGGKRLTRSLSRTSSLAESQPGESATTEPVALAPASSLYGTLLPQPSLPGGTAQRSYKVKWIDEPVSISKFFGASSTKKPPNQRETAAAIAPSALEPGGEFQVSVLQAAVNDWLKAEPQWRAKKAAVSDAAGQIQINVAKLEKDLGLSAADASFCL